MKKTKCIKIRVTPEDIEHLAKVRDFRRSQPIKRLNISKEVRNFLRGLIAA